MLRSRRRRYRRRSRRLPRLKGLSVGKLVPNFITVSALCAGLTGIRFAIEGRWDYAVAAIFLAAILDALDGRMARMLNASSEFGAQLDSLADIVSFGVAPAMVLYFWTLQDAGGVGWAVTLFFIVCCALRLARFNAMDGKLPPYAFNYFTGIPAPAGALMALLPVVIVLGFDIQAFSHPAVAGTWTVIMASMMVGRVPTYSFKRIRVPQVYVLPLLVCVGVLLAALASFPWKILTAVAVLYLLTLPLSVRSYALLKAEAERLHAEGGDADDTGTTSKKSQEPTDKDDQPPPHLRSI
jgi:CDP-diacylglycerol--serine O-phosphatidyltransferase